ncbi:MAG TPA: glycoside hydrolase family 3 N-terminal domain-containing protein [Fimbriimonas sp.]
MLPYQDPDLDVSARVRDLVSRMTLEEKVSQMVNLSSPIERLGIPPYDWWNECLHGVGRAGKATVFPQAIGMAATFDEDLVHRVATAISDEARAKYHEAVKKRFFNIYFGLTYWTPNINIFRDPRWGRGQETYGEDPHLTTRLGVAFVKGLQGDDPKYLKLVATPKHFAVHSGPEEGRAAFDAKASPKDLEETYLPHFRATIQEGGAASIMGAYNRLNGEACNASPTLLQKTLRDEWGFDGYVVSDCGAIENIANHHGLARDYAEASALAVKAGCDLCCGTAYRDLLAAVERGLLSEGEIDRAVARLFTARFRLGMFDPDDRVPFASIPPNVVDSPEHRALALHVAQESIVLLQNNGTLPLSKDVDSIFVTGPNAASLDVLWANYNGYNGRMTTLLEGIVDAVGEGTRVMFYPGCQLAGPETDRWGPAGWEAPQADVIVACMGLSPLMEGEEGDVALSDGGGDKNSVELPPSQQAYLAYLTGLGKKVVLVLTGGSPIALPDAAARCDAIVMAWYPGEEGGTAVADVLFGDVSPAGRLPVTFPSLSQALPPIGDYAMDGRTYRFQKEEPAFRFGFGLSYTTFAYGSLEANASRVRVAVTNTGGRAGSEVVQLYLRDLEASTRVPRHSLAGFRRVYLQPGEMREVEFELRPEQLTVVLDDGSRVLEPGEFEAFVGGGQPGTPGVVSQRFEV